MFPDAGTTRSSSIASPLPRTRLTDRRRHHNRRHSDRPGDQFRDRLGGVGGVEDLQRFRQPQLYSLGRLGRDEPVGRDDGDLDVQALVRPVGVVAGHPRVHRGLGRLHGLEQLGVVEEVGPQRPVQPLNLAVLVRRRRLGEPVRDAVLAADLVEQHLTPRRPVPVEPIGELLAVIRDHLLRHPIPRQCLRECEAHRPRGGPLHDGRHHTESGVIIDPGDQLGLPQFPGHGVDQLDTSDDVDAPQLHRTGPLEPLERLLRTLPGPLTQQPVPDQDPVDRPLRGHRQGLVLPGQRPA
jgi:hypothetical protein